MLSFEALIVTAQSYNHHQDRMEIVGEVAISIVGERRERGVVIGISYPEGLRRCFLTRAIITTLSAAPGVNKLQPADNAAVLQWSYCHEVVAIMSAHLGTGHSGYTARYYRGSLKRTFFWTPCGL